MEETKTEEVVEATEPIVEPVAEMPATETEVVA